MDESVQVYCVVGDYSCEIHIDCMHTECTKSDMLAFVDDKYLCET